MTLDSQNQARHWWESAVNKWYICIILLQKYSKCYSLYSGHSIAHPVTREDIPGHQQRQSTAPSWRSNRGPAWPHPVPQPEVENLPETCRVQGGAGNNRSSRVQIWGPQGQHRGWIHPDNAQVFQLFVIKIIKKTGWARVLDPWFFSSMVWFALLLTG